MTRKSLCESRSVVNLKTLGSRKEDFKNLEEKLINATTQVFGHDRHDDERLDVDRRLLSAAEIARIPFAKQVPQPHKCNDELYYRMVENTEGDAAPRVKSEMQAEGLQAYMRVYMWFAGKTGLVLTEKTRMIMHPTPPKHEHEIADVLEG